MGTADDKPQRDGQPLAGPGATPTAHEGSAKVTPRPPSGRPANVLIGTTISDRYRIERLLGEGGMGAVYQAEHTLMRKRMAIKVLHPEMTRLPEVVARFEREAMAAAHIDHPHVVTATDFGKLEDGSFFLALEYVEGQSLREVIAQGRLDLGRALHIARQIAAALARAHTLKIVHRDLKPENVMLVDREGDRDFVKVLDFGIAKVQIGELTAADVNHVAGPGQQVLTQAGMVYGTPEYMAPEQALGQPVDARADLYALGVITYEMIAGVRPFDADSKVALLGMQVTAPVPPFAVKAPDANVPAEVETLLLRLLAKEATERFADSRDLIEKLGTLLNQLAAAGLVDPRFAPAPTSGMGTSPGLITGLSSPSFADVQPAPASRVAPPSKRDEGFLTGKAWLIAAAGGLLGIIVLVVTIVVVLKGHDPGTDTRDGEAITIEGDAATAPETPLDERVKDAVAKIDRGDYGSGIRTLEELGEGAQGREDVHRALFKAYSQTNRPKEALREARALLKLKPEAASEDKIREEVRNMALREGARDADGKALADDAFSLLENEMGAEGWDILYDMAFGTLAVNFKTASTRAKRSVARGDRAKMSPALAVTLDLQAAGSNCTEIKGLLDRAAEKGDARTLYHLRTLSAPRIVNPGGWKKNYDSLGCIHDGSLTRAISELDTRLKSGRR